MARTARQKASAAAAAAGILVLALGGLGYLRTLTNAERLDDRNLRELARLARGVEGRVNNLPAVLRNLAAEPELDARIRGAALIPHLSVDPRAGARAACGRAADDPLATRTSSALDLADGLLRLCYLPTPQDTVYAGYALSALAESLASDYFETVFLADASGTVFLWHPDRPSVRIRELAAFDTVQQRTNGRVAVSSIDRVPIAGRDYRLYQLPLRTHIATAHEDGDAAHSEWTLGGLIRASSFRQQSLSLGPTVALLLAFLALSGFLAVPFVRVFTMGPRERLGAGNLLYLIIALILAAGLAGLVLADQAHFRQLRTHLEQQLERTADVLVANLERELDAALRELDALGTELRTATAGRIPLPFPRGSDTPLEPLLMQTQLPPGTGRVGYPNLQMAFWADSTGWQVAKWTPRARNTARVDVSGREYFSALHTGRGWPRGAWARSGSVCADGAPSHVVGGAAADSMYVESIRSSTTGEKLAAISSTYAWEDRDAVSRPGVGVVITRLASLDRPVLPPGVQVAVVDAGARTIFHSRAERILEEDFAEETDRPELVRSVLSARACRAFDVTYGGRPQRIAIRPLADKPLYLIALVDRAEMDTIRFEAWYIGGALFGALALLVVGCFVLLELSAPTRIAWAWPDRDWPRRYVALVAVVMLFLLVLGLHALLPARFPTHAATFLLPLQFLGLGLVVLARRAAADRADREAVLGWFSFALATLVMLGLALAWRDSAPVPWLHLFLATGAAALVYVWRRAACAGRMLGRGAAAVPTRFLYTAAMTAGMLVLALLPGYLAYQVAFLTHAELLVKYHQLELDDAWHERTVRLDSIMREDDRAEIYRARLREQTFDLAFEGLAFDTRTTDAARLSALVPAGTGRWHAAVHRLLADRIPFLTDASVGMRQLAAHEADRRWLRAPRDARPLERIWLASDRPLQSSLPPPAGRVDSAWLLGLLAALTGLVLTVYWVARRVFFIHEEHPEPLALAEVLPPAGEEWTSLILVGTRSISRAPIRDRSDEVHFIDLLAARVETGTDAAATPRLIVAEDGNGDTERNVVCLDNFDHCLTDSVWNRALLDCLERLVYADRITAVLILTSRDPEAALVSADSGLELTASERLRWARALGRFTKVMLADLVAPQPLQFAIGRRVADLLLAELESRLPAPVLATAGAAPLQNAPAYRASGANLSVSGAAVRIEWLDAELEELARLTRQVDADAPQARHLHMLAERRRRVAAAIESMTRQPAVHRQNGAPPALDRAVRRRRAQIDRIRDTLLRECGRGERLQQIARQIIARPGWHELTRAEVLDLIREGADSHYSALWAILSQEERLVAAQLAAGAVVNPRSRQAVTRLFARGLVERGPELRLKNESFTRFVRETVPRDVLTGWERADTPSTWEVVRAPLLLGWIGVALFLFWAQRDLLGNAIAFLSTAGVGLAAILRVLTVFERPGAPPPQGPA